MNILSVLACYNSLDILPYVLEYYEKEGIDLFVLDNYSTDGSWEYLQDNKIPSRRLDTDGAFDISMILAAKTKIIHKLTPDWVLRGGSDHFILTPDPLRKTIERIGNEGKYNVISMPALRLWNTGEHLVRLHDPRKVFFYYSVIRSGLPSVHKFKGFSKYIADGIAIKDMKTGTVDGACGLDYGNTRGKEKREEEYKRRQLAWERGLSRGYGTHYAPASKRGWLWRKEEFKDIRKSKYWKMICDRFDGKDAKN